MKSEFENYFRNTLFYSNMLASAAESGVAIKPFEKFKGQYRNTYVQLAYSVYSHQQSKVDELQKRLDAVKGLVIELKKLDMENGSIEITSELVEEIICDLEQALKGSES